MFTSDINTKKACIKTALVYILISIIVALFGAIYELFSHEVYCYFMIYAFAFPLVGGALPYLVGGLLSCIMHPGTITRNLYNSGIATLTLGSVMQGIVNIYGTTNSLIKLYWIAGITLTITGIMSYGFQCINVKHKRL